VQITHEQCTNSPFLVQTKAKLGIICRSRTVIKSVLWLVSNGCLVAEIWPFQVLGWCGGHCTKTKFTFGLHAVVTNYVQTWCKPKRMVYMEKGSMWACVNYDVPSVYAAGCERSGFTTCFPVPWRGRGPPVRSKQAVFRVLNFGRIGVGNCLATAVESVRTQEHPGRLKLGLLVVLTALYKVRWSLLKSDIYIWFSGAPKKSLRTVFQSFRHMVAYE
jgi:hypothetical protein